MTHPALLAGQTALITGAASGIGLATATRFAMNGLNVVLADLPGDRLQQAQASVAAAGGNKTDIRAVPIDVSDLRAMEQLRETIWSQFGGLSILMNNAAVGVNPGLPWENPLGWRTLLEANLWGVINGVQCFAGAMIETGKPGLIINTGSKQGITLPPGNSAYNVSKAAVKAFTELLAHELLQAGGAVRAHLLIPGFTFTAMTGTTEKPDAAWSADQLVDFMLESLERGDFYILCPDNAVSRGMDERRIRWASDDIIKNRPALSRWHPDFEKGFASFMEANAIEIE